MRSRLVVPAYVVALAALTVGPVEAQRHQEMPLFPVAPTGQPVTPIFEGWYRNPDGTYTLSFGYYNHNGDRPMEVPLGEDNFIEPREFDGRQATFFPSRRDRGIFTVTVPATFSPTDRVVWTLRTRSASEVTTHSVPGKINPAYGFDFRPMAAGSLPPALRLERDGPELVGPMGAGGYTAAGEALPPGTAESPLALRAAVGRPLRLTVWTRDNFEPGAREPVAVETAWFTHRGPREVEFAPVETGSGGEATTTATFPEAGEYLLRVRADNWAAIDSGSEDQCCWTNAYVRVTVAP